MRKPLFILLPFLIATNAFSEELISAASTIQSDVLDHARSVIHSDVKNFNTIQSDLNKKITELNEVIQDSELKPEIQILSNTLSEAEVLHELRVKLAAELKSEPTAEELMRTYFELKSLE